MQLVPIHLKWLIKSPTLGYSGVRLDTINGQVPPSLPSFLPPYPISPRFVSTVAYYCINHDIMYTPVWRIRGYTGSVGGMTTSKQDSRSQYNINLWLKCSGKAISKVNRTTDISILSSQITVLTRLLR